MNAKQWEQQAQDGPIAKMGPCQVSTVLGAFRLKLTKRMYI